MDKTQAAKLLGKLGGSVSSEAKALAAKKNGQKGGRPRTQKLSEAKKLLQALDLDENLDPLLAPALKIINTLITNKLIKGYVIGGSLAIINYSEPFDTSDMDVFCHVDNTSDFFHLGPIWTYLEKLGYKSHGLYIIIKGIPVQFLAPAKNNPLEREAMNHAVPITVEGVPALIFTLEYAIAIKAAANRPKDWSHINTAVESADINKPVLFEILKKYNLLNLWRQHYAEP